MEFLLPSIIAAVGVIIAVLSIVGTYQEGDAAGCVFIVLGLAVIGWGLYWMPIWS